MFAIRRWGAVAPGLQQPEQWADWVRKPFVPVGVLDIDVSGIPAMARRRLGYLAKMAVSVADQALTGEMNCAEIPVVWASRYWDA